MDKAHASRVFDFSSAVVQNIGTINEITKLFRTRSQVGLINVDFWRKGEFFGGTPRQDPDGVPLSQMAQEDSFSDESSTAGDGYDHGERTPSA